MVKSAEAPIGSEFRLSLYEEHYSVKCMDTPGEVLPEEYWCAWIFNGEECGSSHKFRLSLYEEHYSVKCMDTPGEVLPEEYWCAWIFNGEECGSSHIVYVKDSGFRLSLYEERYPMKSAEVPVVLLYECTSRGSIWMTWSAIILRALLCVGGCALMNTAIFEVLLFEEQNFLGSIDDL
ncbi:hypothetical protein, conserved [Plasmodium vivax]|nr:hypothetical protein, conserved [Plasmodium vivax]